MNKRQKKKREKKVAWDAEQTYLKQKPKIERYGIDYNHEGYSDPTASAAIRHMMNDPRR